MRRLMPLMLPLAVFLLHSGAPALGQEEEAGPTAAAFEEQLKYQTGEVVLPGEIATLRLPPSLRYLDPQDSRRLLVEAWGNPPDAAEGLLGMLIPAETSPLSQSGWGVVMTFQESGYVDDADAASIDYDAMLAEMQQGTRQANAERKEQGFGTVDLVGWAEAPSYDSSAHKLLWAKELEFDGDPNHTLNYCVRVLGRRGVLELNAVASMGQLKAIRAEAPAMLAAVEFNPGHRYADYQPGTDRVATYGVAGLIAGAAAAKVGLFKGLLVGLLAAKKALIAGVIALVAILSKVLGGKKSSKADPAG